MVALSILLVGGVLLLLPLVFITLLFLWPGVLLKGYNWLGRVRLGLSVRFCYSGQYRFCYSSRGTQRSDWPSLLLLHGFSASKDMWLPIVSHLPRDQHVVCVDMPGHEGTSRTGPEDYSIQGQVTRIHQFVQASSLHQNRFHLVGTSMGGNVAGVYAARYPASICSLTLVCPAGLVYPTDSKFIVSLRELDQSQQLNGSTPSSTPPSPSSLPPPSPPPTSIPLIPSSVGELEAMLSLCVHVPLNLPRPVLRGLLDNRIPNNDFYKEVFMEIVGERCRHSLQESLPLITSPLQVIWGMEDQVLDVSGASVLQGALPLCQVELLPACGHSVALERPRKTAKLIMDFLSRQEVTSGDNKKTL